MAWRAFGQRLHQIYEHGSTVRAVVKVLFDTCRLVGGHRTAQNTHQLGIGQTRNATHLIRRSKVAPGNKMRGRRHRHWPSPRASESSQIKPRMKIDSTA